MRVDIKKKTLCVHLPLLTLPYLLRQMHHISAPCGQQRNFSGGWWCVHGLSVCSISVPHSEMVYFKEVLIHSSVPIVC